MKDRVVLVTGASRGIGAATAKLLGRHGAAVGVNYYSSETAAQEVVDAIAAEGSKALAVKADVQDYQIHLCKSRVHLWLKIQNQHFCKKFIDVRDGVKTLTGSTKL
jgi:NAD(P)-dependent dehydrogenase (short-subunit alcohol dehydrogenase family)